MQATGHVSGPLTDLAASADITGNATPPGVKGGPIAAHIEAHGLPDAPSGRITATGQLAGAPLDLALDVSSQKDGALRATIGRAAWQSAQAHGDLSLPAGATLPLGHLDLKFDRLADLAPLLGRPVSGAVTATLDSTAQRAALNLEARSAGLAGTGSAGAVKLAATIPDPAHPVADVRTLGGGAAPERRPRPHRPRSRQRRSTSAPARPRSRPSPPAGTGNSCGC